MKDEYQKYVKCESAKRFEFARQTWHVLCHAGRVASEGESVAVLFFWAYGLVALITSPVTGPGIAIIDYRTRSDITKPEIEALREKVRTASVRELSLLCEQIVKQSPKSTSSRELQKELKVLLDETALRSRITSKIEEEIQTEITNESKREKKTSRHYAAGLSAQRIKNIEVRLRSTLDRRMTEARNPAVIKKLLDAYLSATHNAGKATMQTMQNFFTPPPAATVKSRPVSFLARFLSIFSGSTTAIGAGQPVNGIVLKKE